MKRILLAAMFMAFCVGNVSAQSKISMDDLLAKVKQGQVQDNKAFRDREARFKSDLGQRTQMLNQVKAEKVREEKRSADLEAEFKANEKELEALRLKLNEELGDLKELFGVIQQTAGEASAVFKNSMTSAQFEGRTDKLSELAKEIGQTDKLVSLQDIEGLWFELHREMTEQGKVVKFNAPVALPSGERSDREVTRVGVFNLVSDGKYLRYQDGVGVAEFARQPQSRYLSQAQALESAQPGEVVPFPVDPTQGQLLAALVESPGLVERIHQGGTVGYVIIALGIVALIIAVIKIALLTITGAKVSSQIGKKEASKGNPLGRVLAVGQQNAADDTETLELKLGEAIMKETPKLNSWLMFIKIIAVVAPLLGLLGTVTGMIQTFQSITLFGSGDPKLMAGGISQALVTTVLGLVVAIPTVLLHTAAATRAKRVQEVLEEQAAGLIATQSEQKHKQ
jgi:biopolymer transport protein ExbB